MRFIADLHIHSHFSIATSKELKPESLDFWARLKGIKLIGTGDFTHPGWLKELKEKLEPAEPGLYKLKKEFIKDNENPFGITGTNSNLQSDVRFMLTAEISNIYKKAGKTRKIHNIVFAPDFETVDRIQQKLSNLGFNITSDGRPILGLDARNLLEILLNCSPDIFFVPAHIWTPWFSVLGANSGFDSIKECYEDLSDNIYAVETGLSSDPSMNWVCSFLDKYTLISNSDAHSPEKLGRNANIFKTDISYPSIINALKTGDPEQCLGTIDLYPQEGKYHYAGHSKCGVCWDPIETIRNLGICPVCQRKITNGVMNRVAQLSDRDKPTDRTNRLPFQYIIPLKEILGEIANLGGTSKKLDNAYMLLLKKLGPELDILLDIPIDEIKRIGNDILAEAIGRMRNGDIRIQHGFDGQYGQIKVFNKDEIKTSGIKELTFSDLILPPNLSPVPTTNYELRTTNSQLPTPLLGEASSLRPPDFPLVNESNTKYTINDEQNHAIAHINGPALVIAGPGTGKTYILTNRIANLVQNNAVIPENILAVTFTNKAANEMKERINRLLPAGNSASGMMISTFHAFGLSILKEHYKLTRRKKNFIIIDENEKHSIIEKNTGFEKKRINDICKTISNIKQNLAEAEPYLFEIIKNYESTLAERNAYDIDDLLFYPVRIFNASPDILNEYKEKYKWILIDEYQDINYIQYQLIRLLMPDSNSNLFAIGDPNQAIYEFRGADVGFINQFKKDYPKAAFYNLKNSYRCTDIIIKSSESVISNLNTERRTIKGTKEGIKINIVKNQTDKSEAEFVARTIEKMIGGLRFFSMDSGISNGNESDDNLTLSDFAVLCRINRQFNPIEKALKDHGIPYQAIGDTPFFKQEPIVSILDFVRYSLNPDNDYLKNRLLEKNIIRRADSPISKTRFEESKVAVSLNSIINHYFRNELSKDEAAIKKLLELSNDFGDDINAFLEYTILGNSPDAYRHDIENVALMTMHASKGLEFKCVFIVGCEDGLIPYSLFDTLETNRDEERRLLYVGMTRAKKHLYLSYAAKRFLFGKEYHLPKSPFINNIELELAEFQQTEAKKKSKKDENQLDLF